jgi:hypothetical protein
MYCKPNNKPCSKRDGLSNWQSGKRVKKLNVFRPAQRSAVL